MQGPIIVINPNSNDAVTQGLNDALVAYQLEGGPNIECVTNLKGPFGIENQIDSDSVIPQILNVITQRNDASSFVIACYSDPGIDACRSISHVPVYGILESGVLMALSRGDQFGVLAIGISSVKRHTKYMRKMGILERCIGERPLNLTVEETVSGTQTFDKLLFTGGQLVDDGADVVILGCAGLAKHRLALEKSLNVPVIDPTQAAVGMALGNFLASSSRS
jgi:allantoin racemase